MQKLFWLVIALTLGLASCENDLDILEEYREIPVIYGLLNPTSTTHYIRVQRAYLGAGNALQMAQEPDSLYYDTATVRVYLEKIQLGSVTQTYPLFPEYPSYKNEGLFADKNHYLFRLNNTRLDPAAQYRLRFQNLTTGKVVTATTRIIEPIFQRTLSPTTRVNLADDDPYKIRIYSSKYGKLYGLIMRIRYTETKKLTQVISTRYLDYRLPEISSRTLSGGEELEFLVNGKSVFQFLGIKIKKDTTVTRRLQDFKADFLFTSATDDFFNYLQINSPNNTVNFIPDFTNLSDGKGIFTCRLDTTIAGISFNELTYDSLATGTYTSHIFE
ncbi:MAG: DUF4249 family protein [Bacteroidia bacterium]|nr:DUF4249 family protein [Bacteroidia bacterium]